MAKQHKRMLTECPNCSSTWGPGSEEWQFQECDSCGYPDNIEENEDMDDDYDQFDDSGDDDPNDSRNL